MKYPWPQPGQCWRGRIHSADYDRWRLLNNGDVVQVYKDGRLGLYKNLSMALMAEEEGSWVRCDDTNAKPKVPDYGEPWRHLNTYLPEDRSLNTVLSPRQFNRAVTCVNALAGIRNPQAVRVLIETIKNSGINSSDYAWFKLVENLDKDPANEN